MVSAEMAWPHCERRDGRHHEYPVIVNCWPHCERLDGMASQISFPHPPIHLSFYLELPPSRQF